MSETTKNNLKADNTLIGLDLFRLICCFSFLICHYHHFYFVNYDLQNLKNDEQPFYSWLRLFYEYGYQSVPVFWSISGFIFFKNYADSINNNKTKFKSFFVKRFSRLYPLHLATLCLICLLQYLYFSTKGFFFLTEKNDINHFFLQIFMASNWLNQDTSFNIPIWSVSVEIVVYAIFFITSLYFTKSLKINSIVILIAVILSNFFEYPFILQCVVFFYAGGIASIASRSYFLNCFLDQNKFLHVLSLGVCVFSILFFNVYLFVILNVVALFYLSKIKTFSHRCDGVIQKLSNLTYATYLIHFPIQICVCLIFISIDCKMPLRNPLFLIIYILSTFTIANSVYKYFELPMQTYIRRKFL